MNSIRDTQRSGRWLLANLAGVFGLLLPLTAHSGADPQDAVARLFSAFAGSTAAPPLSDGVAREFSVFAGSTGAIPTADAHAREFTVFFGVHESVAAQDAAAREFSVLVPTVPVIALNPAILDYPEGSGVVVVDPGASVSDPDATHFGGGTLRVELLAGGASGDVLSIAEIEGAAITLAEGGEVWYGAARIGTYDGGTDGRPLIVNLTSAATLDAAEALLRSVAFANPARFPDAGLRQIGFTLSDGETGEGPTAARGVLVIPHNEPPVAGPDVIGTARDATLVFDVARLLENDSDPDGDPLDLAFDHDTTMRDGTILRVGDAVHYSPPPGFVGADQFSYRLSDPYGGSATGWVTAWVRAPDDPEVSFQRVALTSEGFFIQAVGLPSRHYEVVASDDLTAGFWTPLHGVWSDEIGHLTSVDPDAEHFVRRFYRFGFVE